ncbi:MAG: hypothetical protein KDA79_07665 [Planctomycetaceae bacterium]|nr:hypothetical protein [Planctomycetaceae bacterium]
MAAVEAGKPQRASAISQCVWLAMVAAVAVLVLAGPAWLLGGNPALSGLVVAFALCLPPGCIAVCAAAAWRVASVQVPMVVLAGTGLRLVVVALGALLLKKAGFSLTFLNFTVWLVLAYFVMLAAETRLVLKSVAAAEAVPVRASFSGAADAGQGQTENS